MPQRRDSPEPVCFCSLVSNHALPNGMTGKGRVRSKNLAEPGDDGRLLPCALPAIANTQQPGEDIWYIFFRRSMAALSRCGSTSGILAAKTSITAMSGAPLCPVGLLR
jgi:hypothetical protein